jgi:branched-chain amino acid transport system substrate-binding protein
MIDPAPIPEQAPPSFFLNQGDVTVPLSRRTTLAGLLALGIGLAGPAASAAAQPQTQYLPLLTYRVGPYAPSGIPIWAGFLDTIRYYNEVLGGVDGVKIVTEECETGWLAEKGVECYERLKGGRDGSPVPLIHPWSAPISYALTDKVVADKIPMITINYGRTEATDGAVFPWNFPVMLTFYSEASGVINFIAQKEGGFDKLKGKKIATLYNDSAYGRETLGPLALLSKKYGFQDIEIPNPNPGNEQSAQWQRIREIKPDWVFLRGWGIQTPVAIKTAARVGYPVDHIIGDVWSSSEDDVIPAGAAAKGYLAVTTYPAGTTFPIHAKLKQYILDKGESDLKDLSRFGTVYYNSGIVQAIVTIEVLHTAHVKFGNRPINGVEGRWALEHLNIDDARLEQLGVKGLLQPLKLSCSDHEGGGALRVQQWDGKTWTPISDWIQADRRTLRPLIDEKAAAYAKEKAITPRNCAGES